MDRYLPLIGSLVSIIATGLGGWLAHKLAGAADHDKALKRAQLLDTIATAAAAVVVSLNPTAQWAQLVDDTVKQIGQAAGLTVTDQSAITRAAVAALTALGKNPGAAAPKP